MESNDGGFRTRQNTTYNTKKKVWGQRAEVALPLDMIS